MPISDARDQFADVVSRAVYGDTATYLTRAADAPRSWSPRPASPRKRPARGKKPPRRPAGALWLGMQDDSEQTRAAVRAVIATLMDAAKDTSGMAALDTAQAEHEAGIQPVPWEQVKGRAGGRRRSFRRPATEFSRHSRNVRWQKLVVDGGLVREPVKGRNQAPLQHGVLGGECLGRRGSFRPRK